MVICFPIIDIQEAIVSFEEALRRSPSDYKVTSIYNMLGKKSGGQKGEWWRGGDGVGGVGRGGVCGM